MKMPSLQRAWNARMVIVQSEYGQTRINPVRSLVLLLRIVSGCVCTLLLLSVHHGFAQDIGTRKKGVDWPTFLGSNYDSKSTETGLIVPWTEERPKVVWTKKLSESYCIGSIQLGRFFQPDFVDGDGILYCLNSETGEELWKFAYPSAYKDMYNYNSGPRCSPIVDGDRVYLYGVEGNLNCVNAFTGKRVWSKNVNQEFGVIQNFFGVGSTPVIHKDLLIVMVGGSPNEDKNIPPGDLTRISSNGSCIVAFDKLTGNVRYKSGDDLASYASLNLSVIGGRVWCFAFARSGLIGFNPDSGQVDFQFPWRARNPESVNASNPVIVDDEVFISETYGPGSALLKVKPNGYDVVWNDDDQQRQKSMQTHWNTAIHHDGFVYGSSGRHEYNAELRCIELKTGRIKWSERGLYRSSLLYVDDHFICLSEDGTLRLLRANPEKYDLVSTVVYRDPEPELRQVRPGGEDNATRLLKYPAWAAPVLSHGLLYVRGKDRLACLEVIPEK